MNRNQLWRAIAYSTNTYKGHDELHVFVDAPDYETAKSRIFERLSEEWEIGQPSMWEDQPARIEFHNVWGEQELRDMALGTQIPPGMPLLESGWDGRKPIYDTNPLILVASSRLRDVLECALQEIQAEGARHA
ncbi:hypothetical protein [Serratia fonticola]|uniref:Uncharacterized protein n=1 Tax=Serratia fonticola TaxID=47917 RepID=A0AAW3WN80_SERFO|nr:hypothetical protein [Serratia fonticola]MBC3211077.1 hypothetical protein [Serratia fonticola]NYA12059.1 hypothetical protein [Serratia fonticola]NYA31638.1 hypothetical protein [Serratia fonticola]